MYSLRQFSVDSLVLLIVQILKQTTKTKISFDSEKSKRFRLQHCDRGARAHNEIQIPDNTISRKRLRKRDGQINFEVSRVYSK